MVILTEDYKSFAIYSFCIELQSKTMESTDDSTSPPTYEEIEHHIINIFKVASTLVDIPPPSYEEAVNA